VPTCGLSITKWGNGVITKPNSNFLAQLLIGSALGLLIGLAGSAIIYGAAMYTMSLGA
jgi:hypothetical protein